MPDAVQQPSRALRVWNVALLVALVLLSAFEALVGAFYLPLWWDGHPFPVAALACGLLNAVIAFASARAWPRAGLVPLMAWLLVCLACLVPGPGGSRILLLQIEDWRVPFFLAVGALPAVLVRRFLV